MGYSPSDREYGLNYLRLWWNATPMGVLNLTPFSEAVSYYDGKNPDFLASLGNMAKTINQGKVSDAFIALAKQYGDKYPRWTDFGQALVGAAGTVSAGQIAGDVGSGILEAGGWIAAGVGTYVAIFGVIAVIALLPEIRQMLKSVKLRKA